MLKVPVVAKQYSELQNGPIYSEKSSPWLGFIISFIQRGGWMRFRRIIETGEALLLSQELRAAALHWCCGMTYVPYHKLPYSLVTGQVY